MPDEHDFSPLIELMQQQLLELKIKPVGKTVGTLIYGPDKDNTFFVSFYNPITEDRINLKPLHGFTALCEALERRFVDSSSEE